MIATKERTWLLLKLAAVKQNFSRNQTRLMFPPRNSFSEPHMLSYAIILANLSRFGAQTMAKFLECMLVSELNDAILTRCRIRNCRVLSATKSSVTSAPQEKRRRQISARVLPDGTCDAVPEVPSVRLGSSPAYPPPAGWPRPPVTQTPSR